jgi:hypothetical protein
MDPKFQMLWFLLALICFVVSAFWSTYPAGTADQPRAFRLGGVNLVALGLAFFTVVFFWTAFKAV